MERYLRSSRRHRDLALFMTAIDTMLRSADLLALKVADVTDTSGAVLDRLRASQRKTRRAVYPTLTPTTQAALADWICRSSKGRGSFLFTALRSPHGRALSRSHYRHLVKEWVAAIGLDPTAYSSHSLRRSKVVFMRTEGVPAAHLQRLLGHQSGDALMAYLGVEDEAAQDEALRHNIFIDECALKSTGRLSTDELDALAEALWSRLAPRIAALLIEHLGPPRP